MTIRWMLVIPYIVIALFWLAMVWVFDGSDEFHAYRDIIVTDFRETFFCL